MADTANENSFQSGEEFLELNSELIFEKIFNVSPQVAYVFNLKTQSNEYSNREIGNVLGFTPEEIRDAGPGFLFQLIHAEDIPKVARHHAKLATISDGEILTIEYRIRNKTGGFQTLLSRETVFDRDDTGAVLRMAGVAIDVTDYENAKSTAIAAVEAADLALEDLRAFTYSVSHELRSPAVTVQMLLNELKDGHVGAISNEAHNLIDHALATIDRMQNSILSVLDFNRLLGANTVREDVDLNEVISSILKDRKAEITTSKAQVTIGELPTLRADPTQMRIMFANILDNAIKYASPGTAPEIQIGAEGQSGLTDMVHVVIADNGIGLDPAWKDKIFQMFWRGHTHQEFPGTGLGLALCQRIAQAHGGKLEAQSDGKNGTSFKVTLSKDAANMNTS